MRIDVIASSLSYELGRMTVDLGIFAFGIGLLLFGMAQRRKNRRLGRALIVGGVGVLVLYLLSKAGMSG
ncbi:hypothetical protein [Mycobacterium sp. ACS4331]|uniref:hypothetical protein n=1 Tax=Mycobacterium sp. ACS4331 TaxID=1834121 RepID=UPI0007FBF6CB|nr:hypothetical protein [Mycobacterium sp. ACS4331]OBF18921.1 hypothetical protein A5727_10895 [Mycobacterium sp. ACS4331]